jgi:regulator of protease activity HflC (stomatin/prohibitin superfamily)
VIEAQKINELFAAEQDLEINKILAEAATEKAKADLAPQLAVAELYAAYPGFLELQKVQANANALQPTDKVIFTPEGTVPNLVIPGPGIVPTVNTLPVQPAAPVANDTEAADGGQ